MSTVALSSSPVTFDDFDSPIEFLPSEASWTTNDPSNEASFAAAADFYENTYHSTTVEGASFAFNFTGTGISVFGLSGPTQGSYSIQLDGATATRSAFASANETNYPLFARDDLSNGAHSLIISNLGNATVEGTALTVDYITITVPLGAAGASITNTTIEEDDPRVMYVSEWGGNSNALFSGNGTAFTSVGGASVSLRFNGSAIGIYGDKSNDHGNFTVTLDGTETTLNGVAGCGGTFGKTCEKLLPGLQFFASGLDSSEHMVTYTNIAPTNASFIDLDRFMVLAPSAYAPSIAARSILFARSASTSAAQTNGLSMLLLPFLLLLFLVKKFQH